MNHEHYLTNIGFTPKKMDDGLNDGPKQLISFFKINSFNFKVWIKGPKLAQTCLKNNRFAVKVSQLKLLFK